MDHTKRSQPCWELFRGLSLNGDSLWSIMYSKTALNIRSIIVLTILCDGSKTIQWSPTTTKRTTTSVTIAWRFAWSFKTVDNTKSRVQGLWRGPCFVCLIPKNVCIYWWTVNDLIDQPKLRKHVGYHISFHFQAYLRLDWPRTDYLKLTKGVGEDKHDNTFHNPIFYQRTRFYRSRFHLV